MKKKDTKCGEVLVLCRVANGEAFNKDGALNLSRSPGHSNFDNPLFPQLGETGSALAFLIRKLILNVNPTLRSERWCSGIPGAFTIYYLDTI